VVFSLALVLLTALPSVRDVRSLSRSFVGAAGALLLWAALMFARAKSRRRVLRIEIALRKQHYVQACAQASVLIYWGWYWREVYHSAPLIGAQLLFAYAFDALLVWFRRDVYTFGFGPFPVVFSINLFLWFKPEWFGFQFLLVAVGFAAKELIRWDKDGKVAHVFNPSSFPLALSSVVLIATRSTDLTWGREIATTLLHAPGIYLFIFAAGLVGQYFFGVTTMTMAAAVTMYSLGRLYLGLSGTYFFHRDIPIAVFLGMHLLFTDPSTAPRTELGRVVFGALYAASVMASSLLLDASHAPAFYDKLLPVPILNLTIRAIDRLARSKGFARLDPALLAPTLAPRQRNLVSIGVWTLAFLGMSACHAFEHHLSAGAHPVRRTSE
jgi:hypothetical protein